MTPHVLVIDPDATALRLVERALKSVDLKVQVALNAASSQALLRAGPRLVLCAVELENGDGFAFCRQVRSEPATRNVPFLLLSRSGDPSQRQRALDVEADDYLVKPLYVKDLATLATLEVIRRRSDSTVVGTFEQLSAFFLLRALTSGIRCGTLEALDEGLSTQFREGRLVDAAGPGLGAEDALARLLTLGHGPFRLTLGEVQAPGTFRWSLHELLDREEPRRRRLDEAMAALGSAGAVWGLDIPALARALPSLPPGVDALAKLCDGKRTVVEVMRASNLNSLTCAEALVRLKSLKVIRPAVVLQGTAGRAAPALFEPKAVDEPRLESPPTSPPPPDTTLPLDLRDWVAEVAAKEDLEILHAGPESWTTLGIHRKSEE